MNFECPDDNCILYFDNEEDRNMHSLFTHQKLMPVCSNAKLINQELKRLEAIRRQYKKVARQISSMQFRNPGIQYSYAHFYSKKKRPRTKIQINYGIHVRNKFFLERICAKEGILINE